MRLRYSLALLMAASLSWNPAAARTAALGSVMEAKRVHLNSVVVTSGTTVYDGDRFTTETGGSLRVQSSTAMLDLGEMAVATVRNPANGTKGVEAELDQGTLLFSTTQATSLNIIGRGASIRPLSNGPTFAQISIVGLRELRVCARRGGLQVSYRGEMEMMAEGNCYRVILDPTEDELNMNNQDPKRNRKAKAIFLITLVGGLPPLIFGLHEGFETPESPERP